VNSRAALLRGEGGLSPAPNGWQKAGAAAKTGPGSLFAPFWKSRIFFLQLFEYANILGIKFNIP
jgi:hypothetical protein